MDEMTTVAEAVEPYRALTEQFVAGEISPADFQDRYLDVWADWTRYIRRDVLEVVYPFKTIVTEYSDDPDLRDSGDVGPAEMLAGAWALLAELDREATGVAPKPSSDPRRTLPDPAHELEEKLHERLRRGAIGLYAFATFHVSGIQFRPWVEKCVLFETVATKLIDSHRARLIWRRNDGGLERDATGVDLGLEVWRWPEVGQNDKLVDHLALMAIDRYRPGPSQIAPEHRASPEVWAKLRRLHPGPRRRHTDPRTPEARRAKVTGPDVTITLTHDEAFALSDLLDRWVEDRVTEPTHRGEQVALWALLCLLEGKVGEEFSDDYDVLHRQALARLAEGHEDEDDG